MQERINNKQEKETKNNHLFQKRDREYDEKRSVKIKDIVMTQTPNYPSHAI